MPEQNSKGFKYTVFTVFFPLYIDIIYLSSHQCLSGNARAPSSNTHLQKALLGI